METEGKNDEGKKRKEERKSKNEKDDGRKERRKRYIMKVYKGGRKEEMNKDKSWKKKRMVVSVE